ncbi:MAG: hypothetical protein JHC87_09635 [Thermoleophilaceae bacterium]|nr:hypothetical protein [Thermoleophilaceae bacterium]
MGAVSDIVNEQLAPALAIDQTSADLAGALTQAMFGYLDELAVVSEATYEVQVKTEKELRVYNSGLGSMLDVAKCPAWALDWLAQFSGTGDIANSTEAQKRDKIKRRNSQARGTLESFRAAVEATLTGSKFVYLSENYQGSPYRVLLVTHGEETPGDGSITFAAATRALPAGRQLTHTILSGQTYAEAEAGHATYAAAEAAYTSYANAENASQTYAQLAAGNATYGAAAATYSSYQDAQIG